jgi:hypothetical protein
MRVINSKKFQHRPLADPTSSIRLIKVLPKRSADGLLQCQISHSINTDKYTCLSYVWGQEHDHGGPFSILVNDKTFAVRYNLHTFLKVARSKFPKRNFWIDALCIDQLNTVERNHQVQQMGTIYAKAKEVIAWLGDEKTVEEAIPIIRFLTKFRNFPWQILDFVILESSRRRKQKREKQLGDFQDTFDRYWSRAWITQEITLASHVRILVRHTEWDISRVPHRHATQVAGVFSSYRQVPFFLFWSIVRQSHEAELPLLQLLSRYRDKQCAIERDRIFSLLAICNEGAYFEVDYNCSDRQLLREVLNVSSLSPCICSAEVALSGIDISAMSREDLNDEYFVSFAMNPTHIIRWNSSNYSGTRQCTVCQFDMDKSWNYRDGLIFCLSFVCHEIRGHLFWEEQSPTEGDIYCIGHSSTDSTPLGRIGHWVNVEIDACKELYTISFTLSALLKLFQGRKGTLPQPRLCGIACASGSESSRVKFS